MDTVLKKFYVGQMGDFAFGTFDTPHQSLGKAVHPFINPKFSSLQQNSIDNFFSNKKISSMGQPTAAENVGANPSQIPKAKVMPDFSKSNAQPLNIRETDFMAFDNHGFSNSQTKQVPERNFTPQVLKMQLLEEKIRAMEKKNREERESLRNFVENQIVGQQHQQRPIIIEEEEEQIDERDKQRQLVKEKLEKARSQLNRHSDSDSLSEIEEEKKSPERNKSIAATPGSHLHPKVSLVEQPSISKAVSIKSPSAVEKKSSIKPGVVATHNEAVQQTLSAIKDHLALALQQENIKTREHFSELKQNFKGLRTDIKNKFDEMEQRQILAMENMRYVLEHAGNKKMKKAVRKVFDGEEVQSDLEDSEEEKEKEKRKTNYTTYEHLNKLIPLLQPPQLQTRPERELRPEKEEDYSDLINYLKAKRRYNNQVEDEISLPVKKIETDIKEIRKEQLLDLKEKLKEKELERKNKIGKDLEKFQNSNYQMTKKNTLRAHVYAVIAANSILNIQYTLSRFMKIQSIKMFVNYYESMDNSLSQFLFSSIRIPFLSILNNGTLDLNLVPHGPLLVTPTDEQHDIYIKLETRLDGFIKNISDNFANGIDQNVLSYLGMLITNYSYIPKRFFVLFDYCRLNTTETGELINLDENQKRLILTCYLILRILCKHILIDQQYSQRKSKSKKISNNFKICASVIYRSVIEYFQQNCKIIKSFEEINLDEEKLNDVNFEKKTFYEKNKKVKGKIDKSYILACKKAEKRQHEMDLANEDERSMQRIIAKMPKYSPDTDPNQIEVLDTMLFTSNDLMGYETLAKKNKFDINEKILKMIDKLIDQIVISLKNK